MTTSSELLTGSKIPELDRIAELFFQGIRPERPGFLQVFWDKIGTNSGNVEALSEYPLLKRCFLALDNPALLQDWSDSELEAENFPGLVARMTAWSHLQAEMDCAPTASESQFQQLLPKCMRQRDWLAQRMPGYPLLMPWFWRESARLEGFQGRDPSPLLEKSLKRAGELAQTYQIALTQSLLEPNAPAPGGWLEQQQREKLSLLLGAVPALVACQEEHQLRLCFLETVVRLLPLEAALWLQRDQEWNVLDWYPLSAHPRYSHSLVEQCLESKELSWGQPEQLKASRSILLSEVQSVVALPVGHDQVVFAWQSSRQDWLSSEQADVLKFLTRLAKTVGDKLRLTAEAQLNLAESEKLHRRWHTIFHQAPGLAMAELSDQGQLLNWNEQFSQLFPSARAGQHASQLMPENQRAADRARLQQLQGKSSALMRLDHFSPPRWVQITDWRVADQCGSFRALLDVSANEVDGWFDYLEELNHRLAADLHDGPAQLAAAKQLKNPSAENRVAFHQLRNRLDSLRSPWVDGSCVDDWCQEIVRKQLPECELVLPEAVPEHWSQAQTQTVYRVLVGLVAMVASGTTRLRLSCQENTAEYGWTPTFSLEAAPEFEAMVSARLAVLNGRWVWEEDRLRIVFGGGPSSSSTSSEF